MKTFQFEISPEQHEQMIRCSLLWELEFVSAFIDQQNGQLIRFIDEFNCEDGAEGHGFSYDKGMGSLKVSGLSAFEYDLNGVFKEDLPEYIRKSQLVILWAMLERSLTAIITELHKLRGLPPMKEKTYGSIFIHLIKCLEAIDGKNKNIESSVDFLQNNVRFVRNQIVHSGPLKQGVKHRWLEVENNTLKKIHSNYISEVQSAISCLGNNI